MLTGLIIWLNRLFLFSAGLVLLLMMILACANMVLRFWGYPLQGTFELMGFGGALVASLALGGTQLKQGHIHVDILQPGNKILDKILNLVGRLLCILFFSLLAWQLFALGQEIKASGELSETLHLAYYPMLYAVGLGFILLVMVLILQTIQELRGQD